MEKEVQNNTNTTNAPNSPRRLHAKTRRSGMNIVALFLVRCRKKAPVHVRGKGFWKNLLGAMRPLHHHHQLEHNNSSAEPTSTTTCPTVATPDSFHDVLPPPSPSASTSEAFSSSDGTSRYASADDLRALDTSEEGDEEVADGNHGHGPNAIDVRAEEFIAKFYEQMRLQRLDSIHNNEIVEEGA